MILSITFTNGVALAHTASRTPEWPPHPERLLEALLAGAWRLGGDIKHRNAVRTLEGVAPTIHATSAVGKVPAPVLRYGRYIDSDAKWSEPECSFLTAPVIVGEGPHLAYEYDLPEDRERDGLLREVCAAVHYYGNSASSAVFRVFDVMPSEDGQYGSEVKPSKYGNGPMMRVPALGRIELLEAAYARRTSAVNRAMATTGIPLEAKGKQSSREMEDARDDKNALTAWHHWRAFGEAEECVTMQRYRLVGDKDPLPSPWEMRSVFLMEPVVRVDGTNFDRILSSFRSTWLKALQSNHPSLTGHELDGNPAKQKHVGVLPLLDVRRPYARGALFGFALSIPRSIPRDQRDEALAALHRVSSIGWDGSLLELEDEYAYEKRTEDEGSKASLLRVPRLLKRSSETWATVTPAMPYHHTKAGERRRNPEVVRATLLHMFDQAGLPRPVDIAWSPGSAIAGAPHTGSIRYDQTQRGAAPYQHLTFKFEEPVRGPLFLGRAQCKGYGVCLPCF